MRLFFQNFYTATWAGRLILINLLLFLWLSFQTSSIWDPELTYVVALGAKDPVLLAKGDWWRLFLPIFIHIGFLHFLLNNLALRALGRVLEPVLGTAFLFSYLGGGIAANVLSSYRNTVVGAGASGAIFSLVGVGLVFEWYVITKRNEYPERIPARVLFYLRSPFAFIIVLNFALATFFNIGATHLDFKVLIDNDAHLGGLLFGLATGISLLMSKSYRWAFWLYGVCACLFLSIASYPLCYGGAITNLFIEEAALSDNDYQKFYFLSKALEINEDNVQALKARAQVAAFHSEPELAVADLMRIKDEKARDLAIFQLKSTLYDQHRLLELRKIEALLKR